MTARGTSERVRLVLGTLGVGVPGDDPGWEALALALADARADVIWLTCAVLDSRFPEGEHIRRAQRQIRTDGARSFLEPWMRRRVRARRAPVEVVSDTIVLDVHDTAHTRLGTGIQRVVRQILQHWEGPALLLGWDASLGALRRLTAEELENARHGGRQPGRVRGGTVVVPWHSRYALLELAVEDVRTRRLAAFAEFSGNTTTVIGFDCVPITSGETTGDGMGAAFARSLVAVSRFDRVVPISAAAGQEYAGWRDMLVGTGLPGPEISVVALPWEVPTAGGDPALALATLGADRLPLLLCVGSHEPRKNHMAVLYAAEALWLEGRRFAVAFIGGNSWNSEHFGTEVERLRRDGWPVHTATGVSDDVIAGAYRAAHAVVFPSLNEGFGLPVSEALSVGTPVLTSDYGSMREIGEGHGAVLVDPRDDDSVRDGMRAVMFDEQVRERLRAEIAALSLRTWRDYTRELQALITGDG